MKTLTLLTFAFLLTNSYAQQNSTPREDFASVLPATTKRPASAVEVREMIEEGKSTLLFNVVDTDWLKINPELIEHITTDYSFVSTLLFDPETREMSVFCERNITLSEINELMKEFSISVYQYKGEIIE